MASHGGGASCWICLEGGTDECPLRRDCSCRGDSGLAHTNCLVKYCEHKSRSNVEDGKTKEQDFHLHWEKCPNCKQLYRNKLGLDLARALLSFAERLFGHAGGNPGSRNFILVAYRTLIQKLANDPKLIKEEKSYVHKMLSLIEKMKKDFHMDDWIHKPPDSVEFCWYKLMRIIEAFGIIQLGHQYSVKQTEEAIHQYKKAQVIYRLLGCKNDVKRVDNIIANFKIQESGDTKALIKRAREDYTSHIRINGENAAQTIEYGLRLASLLAGKKYCIEAERLLTKLAASSYRVHGPEHKLTKDAQEKLEWLKERLVLVGNRDTGYYIYQALRYENDGELCIVKGPLSNPGDSASATLQAVPSNYICLNHKRGCPVICQGLMNASHLNGKIGDVRSVLEGDGEKRYAVHFEDENLKPALVKAKNVRIVFDLREKK